MECYDEYKDSGIEWIGEIPEHWEVKKLKYIIDIIQTGTTPATKNSEYFNGGIDWFNPVDLNSDRLIESKRKISKLAIENGQAKIFPKDSILIVAIGATSGKTSYLTKEASFNQQITGFHSKKDNNYYFYFVFKSFSKIFLNLANYTTLPILNNNFFKSFTLTLPTKNEQIAIANYLNKKTAEIDNLISQKEQLLELYEEEKKRIINQAVTKGINPAVNLKDSGIAWIGNIPEEWKVKKLKYSIKLQNKKKMIDNHKVIALENIESWTGRYINTDAKYQGENIEFKDGDILFGKLRPYLAKVFKCEYSGIAFGDLLVYRPSSSMDSTFSFYYMISKPFIGAVNSSAYGTKMPRASSEFINNMPVLAPSLEEQIEVIDKKKQKTKKLIALQKEYRTALISEVITGKVKVTEEM